MSYYRISAIVWHCILGRVPDYLQELFTLTLACSGHRSLHSESLHMPSPSPDRIGLFQLWDPLLGITSPLTCVLSCRTNFALFKN